MYEHFAASLTAGKLMYVSKGKLVNVNIDIAKHQDKYFNESALSQFALSGQIFQYFKY